jgi:uncharacterized membrane protein YoaK (UPF0700 family)
LIFTAEDIILSLARGGGPGGAFFMKKRAARGQMSEALLTAVFLSLSGGLQDAYTYIFRGGVFANAQTGNIVLLSVSLFDGEWTRALHYFVPVLAFALGVLVSELIRARFKAFERLHWRQLVLAGEIVLLFVVAFLPEELNMLANATVSFSCAMQVQAFRKVNGYAFASTMCIGNLRSGVESLCAYMRTGSREAGRKSSRYFGVIALFALGAGAGGACIPVLGARTIWLSCALLAVSFALMFIKEDIRELEEQLEERKN